MPASLTPAQRRFLENPFVGVVTTLRPDGSPHSTVVWVDVDDEGVSFNTEGGRAKPRNLEHDTRAALLVLDPGDPYRWLAVDGPTESTTEGARGQIDRLAKKYTGADEYGNPILAERITVRFRPERIEARGIDE